MVTAELSPRKVWNAARKLVAGLPLGGEAVWPGLRNDLFVAHESIYVFASQWARDRHVLDAACGTGYGSFLLLRAGAASVVGIDRNVSRIRFAARRYRNSGLTFKVADCEDLSLSPGRFDLVVSSNTLEHLARPTRFLESVGRGLASGGQLIVAVPPVLSEADLREHAANPDHVSNLSVLAWAEIFEQSGWECMYFSHRCKRPLDFQSLKTSAATPRDFAFIEEGIHAAYESAPITAVYRLRRAC